MLLHILKWVRVSSDIDQDQYADLITLHTIIMILKLPETEQIPKVL